MSKFSNYLRKLIDQSGESIASISRADFNVIIIFSVFFISLILNGLLSFLDHYY